MDPLSDVLRLLKPASFGFRGLNAGGSWQLQFPASAGIKAYAIESGTCWMLLDPGGNLLRLGPGDVMRLPGRSAFRLYTPAEIASQGVRGQRPGDHSIP